MDGVVALNKAKNYVDKVLNGVEVIKGDPGKDAPTITNVSVNENNVLSTTLSDGTVLPGGTIQTVSGKDGIAGTDGKDGQDGQDGITPHIDPTTKHWFIGATDTGVVAEGQDGTDGLQGIKGDKGDNGEQGDPGVDGKDGITYQPTIGTVSDGNIASASIDIDNDSKTAKFNFVLPKGEKGDKGDMGTTPSNPEFDSATIGRLKITGYSDRGTKYNDGVEDNIMVPVGKIEVVKRSSDEYAFSASGLEFVGCDAKILPSNSACVLGSQKRPFFNMFAWGFYQPSDEKYKNIISTIENSEDFKQYENLFDSMEFILYQKNIFEDDSPHMQAITKPHGRYHIGVGAQKTEKLIDHVGLDSNKFSGIKSSSFSTLRGMEHKLSGGWRANKIYDDKFDDDGNPIEVEYSENAYKYKKHMQGEDVSYETYNEILEVNVANLHISKFRESIGYILIEDNSKIKAVNPPNIQLNSVTLVDANNNYYPIDLSGEIIPYYDEWDETNTPLSSAIHNADGSVTASFDQMYSSVLIRVEDFDITQYEKVIVDVNHIAEYNIMFIPSCPMGNAYLWDHKRNDSLIFDYTVDYNQIWGLSAAMLQHTRKQFKDYKEQTDNRINQLEKLIESLRKTINMEDA